jgi:RNA polymerase sigma-B factor
MSDGSPSGDLDDLELFREFARTRSRRVRNQLVERHMGLAAHIANRFRRSGGTDDDLRQVAMLGLVKAVDRFDPEFGATFSAFAGRTIEGELKRHFRDRSWVVRVPRGAKELHLLVRNASERLSHELERSPTVDEIAAHLGVERDDVLRGLAATAAYSVGTLDSGTGDDDEVAADRQRALASQEPGYDDADNRSVIAELLERLPERERQIVRLRFYDRMSQSEIAAVVGVSQMHVSRLLRRSFEQMREWMLEGAGSEELGMLQSPDSSASALE